MIFRGLFIILLFMCLSSTAQSQINLQNYTPSIMLLEDQWEFKNFHNFYTQTKQFGPGGGKILTGDGRESYYTMINQFLYGLSDRVSIGADVWIKSVNLEKRPSANWTAVTGIGPKIKWSPTGIPGFSMQSTLLFPAADDLEGRNDNDRAFLESDRTLWINQLFYDKIVAPDFQIFAQLSIWYSFVRNSGRSNNFAQTPMSIFLNYLPTNRFTVYVTTEYWPVHYNTNQQKAEPFQAYFIQAGVGTKYQIIPGRLEGELLYTNFVLGSIAQGAGETFNVGLRVIR